MPAITRKAQMCGIGCRSTNLFGCASRFTRVLLHRHPPDPHASTAIAAEIEPSTVRRPHRIPVDETIARNPRRLTSFCRNRPEVAIAIQIDRPVSDVPAVRRPLWLHRIVPCNLTLTAGSYFHRPKLALNSRPVFGPGDAFLRIQDPTSVP